MLLVTVLAIWGIIGFKMVSTLNPDAPKIEQQNRLVTFSPKTNAKETAFTINTADRDPFLGTLYITHKTTIKPKITTQKEAFVWIPIVYHGTISTQQSKSQIFIISISGQQYVMKVGQEMNEVKLLKANNKDILVSYKGARKTISKL